MLVGGDITSIFWWSDQANQWNLLERLKALQKGDSLEIFIGLNALVAMRELLRRNGFHILAIEATTAGPGFFVRARKEPWDEDH